MLWQGTLENSSGEVVERSAGPAARRVVSFYERALPGFFRSARDAAAASIHLGFWDGKTHTHREAALNATRALASEVAVKPGERVLDAGCGVGSSAVLLAREFGAKVVGVNLSASQIYHARRLAHRESLSRLLSFERRDFVATDLPDESFDVVWAVESVCHAADKGAFLEEAWRLLKPGGRIVVADLFRSAEAFGNEEERLLKLWLSGWALPDLFTGEGFAETARRAGFEETRVRDATAEVWPSLRNLQHRALLGLPAARALRILGLCDESRLAPVRSGMLQFEALGRGLWFYGIFTAAKSRLHNGTPISKEDP